MKTNVRRTSLNAWNEEMRDKLPSRQFDIYFIIHRFGPMTDDQLSKHLNVPINGITGSRNRLVEDQYLFAAGTTKGPTGRSRTLWSTIKQAS